MEQGKLSQAIDHLQEATRLDKSYAMAFLALGDAYHKIGEKAKALEQYKKADDLFPPPSPSKDSEGGEDSEDIDLAYKIDTVLRQAAIDYEGGKYQEAHNLLNNKEVFRTQPVIQILNLAFIQGYLNNGSQMKKNY
ncbi:tetratricopeptide repeat protein [Nostoc sp.]|uniref:tetratricopeptide repeat protein n=1 Tax=Nostoc sp. TaxID=1180 RepID=UPI002FF5C462